jgi:CheY-like chemotaxis protein
MPQGGALTIETAHVHFTEQFARAHGHAEPGPYALLSVRDTGQGIPDAVKERIFEPFFTTKEVGKGTGLGLSIVYGIVKQHGGYITVESEPDRGTTFNLYFPLVETKAENFTTTSSPPIRGGTETVLVAEDEDAVRKLTKSVLEGFGYKVIEATDGNDALSKFLKVNGNVHLLLFDVVMPKKNGKEAYDEIRRIRPDMKVLFMSGYTAEVLSTKGGIDEDVRLIRKPISPKELLRRVRETLDA